VETLEAGKSCVGCDLCCRLYEIEELAKPVHASCVHARVGGGCGIHGLHPMTCRTFQCLWLSMDDLGPEWKPSIAGFILRAEENSLYVDVDPERPGAWLEAPYYQQIKSWSEVIRDGRGLVSVEDRGIHIVFPEREIYLGRPPRGALIEAGYARRVDGTLRPWARLAQTGSAAAA
jgi:hypothetical protein